MERQKGAQRTHKGNGETRRPRGRGVWPPGAHGYGQGGGIGVWATLDGYRGALGCPGVEVKNGHPWGRDEALRASWAGSHGGAVKGTRG